MAFTEYTNPERLNINSWLKGPEVESDEQVVANTSLKSEVIKGCSEIRQSNSNDGCTTVNGLISTELYTSNSWII